MADNLKVKPGMVIQEYDDFARASTISNIFKYDLVQCIVGPISKDYPSNLIFKDENGVEHEFSSQYVMQRLGLNW